ncbi:MAG: FlgD immunoglobulin-like domain containing protein [bacterium]
MVCHNILYIDQDYFCAHEEYGCDWDEELSPGEFMYDYFGVALAISDNHGADVGDYESVAVGVEGDPIGAELADRPINFRPEALTDSPDRWNWPDWIDREVQGAARIFTYRDSQFGAGVRYDGGHFRTVYIPWQLDFAVDTTVAGDLVPRSGAPLLIQNGLWWFGTENRRLGTNPSESSVPAPTRYVLHQNHPNPFNSETKISYQTAEECLVELTVYNVLGQKIRTLFEGEQVAGSHNVAWDGKDDLGFHVSTGVYFYKLETDGTSRGSHGDFVKIRRTILLR